MLADELGYQSGGRSLHSWDHVVVLLQRGGRRLATESLAHDLDRHAGLRCERRVRMPKVMQADRPDAGTID